MDIYGYGSLLYQHNTNMRWNGSLGSNPRSIQKLDKGAPWEKLTKCQASIPTLTKYLHILPY